MNLKIRLSVMSFLQFAAWGAYLPTMGSCWTGLGMGDRTGWFYALQGATSLFMPALMGRVADRRRATRQVLGVCHAISALFMAAIACYGTATGSGAATFGVMLALCAAGTAFYVPTLSLSNAVAYAALEEAGKNPADSFPAIRLWGTVGFIAAMLWVDGLGLGDSCGQFFIAALLGMTAALWTQTLPAPLHFPGPSPSFRPSSIPPTRRRTGDWRLFLLLAITGGTLLQVSNGFAHPYLRSFGEAAEYADSFGVRHAGALLSLSQVSETLCLLLLPPLLRRFGFKRVMTAAMLAWAVRFAFLGIGNPGGGVWLFIFSMIAYGVAFDCFCIAGSLYVNREAGATVRAGTQGLFTLATSGVGSMLGIAGAQAVVSHFTYPAINGETVSMAGDWRTVWLLFAAYSIAAALLLALFFPRSHATETNTSHRDIKS